MAVANEKLLLPSEMIITSCEHWHRSWNIDDMEGSIGWLNCGQGGKSTKQQHETVIGKWLIRWCRCGPVDSLDNWHRGRWVVVGAVWIWEGGGIGRGCLRGCMTRWWDDGLIAHDIHTKNWPNPHQNSNPHTPDPNSSKPPPPPPPPFRPPYY